MSKTKQLNVKVETLPNGYSLTVGKTEYMYFNLETLITGIAYHAVDDNAHPVDIREISNNLGSYIAFIKSTRQDIEKLLDEIDGLRKNLTELKKANSELRKANADKKK